MKTAFRWLIKFYRMFISPMLGPRCRFYPSCSIYALEALEQHSLGYALWLIVKRLGRCQPWGGSGYDPVPLKADHKDGHDDKKTDLKKNSVIKAFLVQFFSTRLICHCDVERHAAQKQVATHRLLIQTFVNDHQSCHQNRKFTPYTNPPHRHSLFFLNGFCRHYLNQS